MQSFSSFLRTPAFSSSQNSAAAVRRNSRKSHLTVCASDRNVSGLSLEETARNVLKGCVVGAAAVALSLGPVFAPETIAPKAEALLTGKDPEKNANALLRIALPIDNKPIRTVQLELDGINSSIRIPGSKAFGPLNSAVRKSIGVLNKEEGSIVKAFAPEKKEEGVKALANLKKSLAEFQEILAKEDKNLVIPKQQEALEYLNVVENAMVKGFPFEVPSEYSDLPQLKGRATVDLDIKFSSPREANITGGLMRIVVDGYNAPISGGDFVDLVSRGFYDGMDIQRADGFVVQTGKPSNGKGFVDPDTGKLRTIPFEVMVKGDKVPVYEETLEDLGRFNEEPVLPFNAYGTVAMARSEFEANDASSQFFFLLKLGHCTCPKSGALSFDAKEMQESELTPTGSNLLDGRYAVFGYVTQGAELLKEMQVGDKIVSAKVIDGSQFLQQPKKAVAAVAASE